MCIPAATFASRLAAYRNLLVADIRSWGPVRLLTQMPGNTGDHLIWSGTEALLAAAGIPFGRLAVAEVATSSFPDECLIVPGSGALTRAWHEWLPALIIEAATRFRSVVILPSQYDPSVDVVAEALATPNVYAYAREADSYVAARPFGRASLAFDPALYSPLFQRVPSPVADVVASPRRLVALREDKSSRLSELGYATNPAVNRDISLTTQTAEAFVAAVRDADEVITDRLHVAVATVMCGKRLVYFDPQDRKISTYVRFTFRDAYAATVRPCSVEQLVEMGYVVRP